MGERTRTNALRVAAALWVTACGGSAASDAEEIAPPDDAEILGPPVRLGGDDPCPPQPLTLADTLAAVLTDVRAQPASSRPFLRYVSAGQFRPGPCGTEDAVNLHRRELPRARMAVSKILNGMSREPRAVVPEAVGPEGLLLRLDLRNYGWQRPVTLGGESYGDAWQAVAARAAIALELRGGVAGELERELGTRVPVLLSSAFVATAARGELYYAVLRLPATLGELKRELGIDGDEDLERGPWARAAFSNSGVSTEPRGVARYRGGALGDGYFWQTFDFAPSASSEALYLEPLTTRADSHEVLFSLPNGLPAYYAADGEGSRLLESRFVLDPAQNNGTMRVTSSCVGCHNSGIILFNDEARRFVEDNADLFPEAVLARARETFPPDGEMAALRTGDGLRISAAFELAGQPEGTPDPLARTFLDYELALTFDRLAAELFLDRSALIERLSSVPEDIATAATSGVLERSVFEARYLEAACALYGAAESSPVGCP
jgi:serine/threonine-protein kinase